MGIWNGGFSEIFAVRTDFFYPNFWNKASILRTKPVMLLCICKGLDRLSCYTVTSPLPLFQEILILNWSHKASFICFGYWRHSVTQIANTYNCCISTPDVVCWNEPDKKRKLLFQAHVFVRHPTIALLKISFTTGPDLILASLHNCGEQ